MEIFNPQNILDKIDSSVEKTCSTCNDQAFCELEGKDTTTVCEHWKLDFTLFQDTWEKIAGETRP